MDKLKSFIKHLKAFDVVVVIFYIILSIVHVIFRSKIDTWFIWIAVNFTIILTSFLLAYLESKYDNEFWNGVHYWYIVPVILLTFKQLYFMVKPIRVYDYDYLFIDIDRWLFGTDPTHLLYQISNPVLTELLQIVYGSFYLLPILLGLFLLRKRRFVAMDFAVFALVYGFYLSYLGYFILPGIGPRFTLHDFSTINEQLPGLFLTNFLRELVNAGESIPVGTPNPAEVVQRDIFPSGHTMMTLIVMFLSVRLKSRSKYFFVPVGTLLIFSTVYLWYHYVIDLVGGLAFMLFAVWSGKYIFNWWRRKIDKPEFEYDKY
ncbi:MAG: phosphatase PAP2 family protein [Ignavibacteria bacterium]|nr:phosphatase PAP2 family protein [Ignavibacteria bacterium]MBT8383926.1 phosphatase PAP2 family protein [Ignavibacteria bacterium]MBT8391473.1 phosphatase PAP2 family protein [Ignavibacteria bacterium]NNJ54136.1 phosphatase PAP2 family protein [Ignavibacteriaceae bacterium]NNL21403.1 phosphatase PAP2 family protein [Ignavibacteriaceae bacterium]